MVSAVIQSPRQVETMGICGALQWTSATALMNSPTMGSIMDEWNACDVCNGRVTMPSVSKAVAKAATDSFGPATTHRVGALFAASCRSGGNRAAIEAAAARTDSIDPGGIEPMSRPRRATSRMASGSWIAPAMQAQTNSATL